LLDKEELEGIREGSVGDIGLKIEWHDFHDVALGTFDSNLARY